MRIPVYAARVEDGFVVVEPREAGGDDLLLLRRRLRRDRYVIEQRRSSSVRGDPDASRQLRPPVHQGRRAAPVDRRGRAPALPGGRTAARDAGTRRWTMSRERFRQIIAAARPGRGGLLHLRPAAHRGLLRLQQAGEGPDRHQQRRHQLAPVHVLGGRGLQAVARRRRAAVLLRGHRRRRPDPHRRLEHRVRPPGRCSGASRRRAKNPALK